MALACIGVKISKLYAQTEDMGVDIIWIGKGGNSIALTIPNDQLYDINYDPSIPYNGQLGTWELTTLVT